MQYECQNTSLHFAKELPSTTGPNIIQHNRPAPETGSSAAVTALGSHEAGQQVQGGAALGCDAGQHIAVSMQQSGLQAGRPVLVAVGALGRDLDAA